MKQRLGIAQAILHNPDILFFDEPNNGLDPMGISTMNKTIDNLNKEGKTIFISTHILEDVKELCSHVIVLRDGKLVLDESIEGLIENEDIYIWLKIASLSGKLSGLIKLKYNANSNGVFTTGVADNINILVLLFSFFSC